MLNALTANRLVIKELAISALTATANADNAPTLSIAITVSAQVLKEKEFGHVTGNLLL